jgi:hypothetical protein
MNRKTSVPVEIKSVLTDNIGPVTLWRIPAHQIEVAENRPAAHTAADAECLSQGIGDLLLQLFKSPFSVATKALVEDPVAERCLFVGWHDLVVSVQIGCTGLPVLCSVKETGRRKTRNFPE